jgi:glycerol-3-phosphate acyltransferase PlsY
MALSILISAALILIAYLLGSLPTGYLIARALKGIDIRQCGSGSTGATNVLRIVGKEAALAVLIIDMFKGAIALMLVKVLYLIVSPNILPLGWKDWLIVIGALVAVLGHSRSIWLNFTGGKSAAISLGVLIVMNPFLGLGTLLVFLAVLASSRIVSLSSMSAAISVNILMWLFLPTPPYILFGIIAGIYVITRHRSNIERLIAGTEPRIGQTT